MAQFPRTESQVIMLVRDIAAGLGAIGAVYPVPPVAPAALQTRMAAYITARHVGMAIGRQNTLTNQERGKEWEYGGLAVNKAGEGQPSNAVMAVL